MRALDLYCGAGGAGHGLALAGFEVVGVDVVDQPNYPYAFVLGNALEFPLDGFDFIWASPPCQKFTAYRRRPGHVKHAPDLIAATRELLSSAPCATVIENVPAAPLVAPVMLCGSMFGLDVRRHRHFELSFPVLTPECNHAAQLPRFPPATNRSNLRRTVEVGVWRIPLEVQQAAMGIDWMSLKELSQAIPPAYSKFLAEAWLASRKEGGAR